MVHMLMWVSIAKKDYGPAKSGLLDKKSLYIRVSLYSGRTRGSELLVQPLRASNNDTLNAVRTGAAQSTILYINKSIENCHTFSSAGFDSFETSNIFWSCVRS